MVHGFSLWLFRGCSASKREAGLRSSDTWVQATTSHEMLTPREVKDVAVPCLGGALVPSSSPVRIETSCSVSFKSWEEERGTELGL